MTKRIGLALVVAIGGAASLPGCAARPQQHVITDQSWSARDNDPGDANIAAAGYQRIKTIPDPMPVERPVERFVPPKIDPPPLIEPTEGPKLEQKPVPGNPTSFQKKTGEPTKVPPWLQPQEPVTLALQCMLDNRHQEALEHLKKYDAATQELYIRLLPVMAVISKKGLDKLDPAELATLREQLQAIHASLRNRSELTIDKMCFCQRILAYGKYEELPANYAFTAGAPNRPGDLVQLYVEPRNFGIELRDGRYEIRLASSVEILDLTGRQVWFKSFEDSKKPYQTTSLLYDYYNNYRFYVPHLPAGNYLLKLRIVDESRPEARRSAYKTLDFRVTTLPR